MINPKVRIYGTVWSIYNCPNEQNCSIIWCSVLRNSSKFTHHNLVCLATKSQVVLLACHDKISEQTCSPIAGYQTPGDFRNPSLLLHVAVCNFTLGTFSLKRNDTNFLVTNVTGPSPRHTLRH